MGRPRHADGRQTRQAILDAALDLFADKGYFGTSLRDIAAVVGVRESALYNYFPRKEALFEALLVSDHDERVERFAQITDGPIGDARGLLERLTSLALESFCVPRQEQLFRVLMTDGIRLTKEGRINLLDRLSSGQMRLQHLMRRLTAEGWLREADPELLAMAFAGPLLFWRQLHAVRPELPFIVDRQAFARGHVDQFLSGAAPRAADRPARAARRAATRRSARARPRPRPRSRV